MDKPCPVCGATMPSRELAGQSRRLPYLTCPVCAARITHGGPHKRRLIIALVLAVATLGFLLLGSFRDGRWTIAAGMAALALIAWIAWCERRVHFVRYDS